MAFYDRIFSELSSYIRTDSDVSEPVVFNYILQLLENDTPMPAEFLDNLESKMGIFKELKLKIRDEDVKKNIDRIWIRWSDILFEKERRAEEGSRRNDLLVLSSHIGSDSFILSPSYTNTPSVASLIFTPSPLHCYTPAEDRIIEDISIPVYSEFNPSQVCGFFKYSKKQSGKVVCNTEHCRVSNSKRDKLQHTGVTLQTLKGHARKDHSIELDIKQRRGRATQPLICEYCSKTFIREQTLKSHIAKLHRGPTTDSEPPTPAPVPPAIPSNDNDKNHLYSLADFVQSPLTARDNLEGTIDIQSLLTPYEISAVQDILDSESL